MEHCSLKFRRPWHIWPTRDVKNTDGRYDNVRIRENLGARVNVLDYNVILLKVIVPLSINNFAVKLYVLEKVILLGQFLPIGKDLGLITMCALPITGVRG